MLSHNALSHVKTSGRECRRRLDPKSWYGRQRLIITNTHFRCFLLKAREISNQEIQIRHRKTWSPQLGKIQVVKAIQHHSPQRTLRCNCKLQDYFHQHSRYNSCPKYPPLVARCYTLQDEQCSFADSQMHRRNFGIGSPKTSSFSCRLRKLLILNSYPLRSSQC